MPIGCMMPASTFECKDYSSVQSTLEQKVHFVYRHISSDHVGRGQTGAAGLSRESTAKDYIAADGTDIAARSRGRRQELRDRDSEHCHVSPRGLRRE